MSDLRTAAQQALRALEAIDEDPHGTHSFPALSNDAITALKAALAQQDEMQEMLRTLGFDHQCPESIGITLRRWRDGYAAALAQQEQEPHWLTKELMADYLDMVAEAIENDSSETLRHKAHWMRRDGEV
jgi:hypothetical protein